MINSSSNEHIAMQDTVLLSGTEFVPMIFLAKEATAAIINAAKGSGSGVLLGFNEPNEQVQGNTTVAVDPRLLLSLPDSHSVDDASTCGSESCFKKNLWQYAASSWLC